MLVQYFPDAVDAHTNLIDVWATLEAKAGHADEARDACWAPLLQNRAVQVRRDLQKRYAWWEVQWGSIAKLREFYREMLGRKRGAPPVAARRDAAAAWVRAEERYGGVREEVEARRALLALSVALGGAGDEGGAERQGGAHEDGGQDSGKRKHGAAAETGQEKAPKRAKVGDVEGQRGGEGAASAGGGGAASKATEERAYDDTLTVFVKHLHERVTEADLKELFPVRI